MSIRFIFVGIVFLHPFFEKEVMRLDYVIKNHNNVYIRLNENGSPITCVEQNKMTFEYSKAKNILGCLPKTLRKLNFKIEPIPEIIPKEDNTTKEKKIIQKENYTPSETITQWIEKFGVCGDILNEAKQREKQLLKELDDADNELLDILHVIEIEKSKDLYGGWKEYMDIRKNREKRRYIKDELLIVENVLEHIADTSCLQRERVKKSIEGLFTRKYSFKIVEEREK